MRTTSSFAVFRHEPGEHGLAKPRWLARDGRLADAEAEYRRALGRDPDLRAGWIELFEVLRRLGRHRDAAALADDAERHWGADAALPHTLRGAALVEMGRLAEGIAALQQAIACDDGFALAWHEYGYASSRAGHLGEALLALDRAFALEPHTDTLMLRGRILRDGGRYDAAEVAFEGALQATEHDVPRHEAEREIAATRRAAAVGGGRRPRDFTPRERWFARGGGILLEPAPTATPVERVRVTVAALAALAQALEWRPAAVAGVSDGDGPLAGAVAAALGAQALAPALLDPADRPLLVTMWNDGLDAWGAQLDRLTRWRCGCAFALYEPPDAADPADVVGFGESPGEATLAEACGAVGPSSTLPADPDPEALALARHPLAGWARRATAPPPP